LIEVMKMKMQMIQFVSILNWIQMKLSDNGTDQKKACEYFFLLLLSADITRRCFFLPCEDVFLLINGRRYPPILQLFENLRMSILAALIRVAATSSPISEMQMLVLPIESGTKTDLTFSIANTAVLFNSTTGFSALVSVGHQTVRHFGSIGEQSDAVGVFFGDDLGKIRILGHSTFALTIYALVPPVPCARYWITTAPAGVFSIGGSFGNVTDEKSVCFWHVHPSPRTYATVWRNVQPAEALRVFRRANESAVLGKRLSLGVTVALIHYRPGRKTNGRFIEITFSVDKNESFPLVQASLAGDGPAALLHAANKSVRLPEQRRFRKRTIGEEGLQSGTQYFSMVHLVVALGVIVLVALATGVLVIARCLRKGEGWGTAALKRGEVALLGPGERQCMRLSEGITTERYFQVSDSME
jgi:hypothetical protein